MTERLCRTCGGEGIIDEMTADKLRLDLGDAMVDWCPRCGGAGVEPDHKWPFIYTLLMGLLTWSLVYGVGAMMGFCPWP